MEAIFKIIIKIPKYYQTFHSQNLTIHNTLYTQTMLLVK